MTPTTLQDRVIAYKCFELPGQPMYTHTGTSCLISDLFIAVEALTKERDEYAKAADTMAMQHKVERDALAMANRDLINWFDALKADHDKLAADAARYCWMTEHIVSGELEALEKAFTTIGEEKESITQAEFDAVIDAAIQEAGVQ